MELTKVPLAPALTQEPFAALSRPEQRVAIAKDILAQIAAERIIPCHGIWVDAEGLHSPDVEPVRYARETLAAEAAPRCYVCGVGACIVSAIRLGNRLDQTTRFGLSLYGEAGSLMDDYFTEAQLAAIEYAFECGCGATSEEDMLVFFDEGETQAYMEFGQNYLTASEILTAICKSIIANGGYFPPPRQRRSLTHVVRP